MTRPNRRDFLRSATIATTALSQFPAVLRGAQASDKLKVGLIGCGWYGMVDVKAAFEVGGVEVVSLCDVDSDHLAKSARDVEGIQNRKPETFKRHEDLLKGPALDAVIIGSPPQWHALHFLACLDKGLDVYLEKPLSYDIREGRAMAEAAKKSGRIVQVGFQRRQNPAFQQVRRYIQDGKAGKIICADANIHYTAGVSDPTPQDPPPALDWDRWCGPAPKIPYSPQVGHMNWRLEKTTGHGHLVDWGIHLIDAARVILGESTPKTVTAAGGLYYLKDKITTPDVLTAHFEFASCPLTWHHRIWGAQEYTPPVSNGIFLYGEKETVFVTDDRWEVIPRGKPADRRVEKAPGNAGVAHMKEFLEAVRTRKQPGCLVEDAYLSTTCVKLAMISYDTGSKVTWDQARETIPNNTAATALLRREYRNPWVHPGAPA